MSVGLHGHLQFADISENTKRLKKLYPEDKVDIEFSLIVSGFDCNSATIHLSFFNSESSYDDEESAPAVVEGYEKHGGIVLLPGILSESYIFDLSEFLIPLKYTSEEFIGEWNRFPAGFVLDLIFNSYVDKIESLVAHLSTTPFHHVLDLKYAEGHYFQVAYSAMTWFEEQLLFTITGNKTTLSSVVSARFEFRASKLSVLVAFHQQIDFWIKSWLKNENAKYVVANPAQDDIFCEASDEIITSGIEGTQAEAEEEMLQKWRGLKGARFGETPAATTPYNNMFLNGGSSRSKGLDNFMF